MQGLNVLEVVKVISLEDIYHAAKPFEVMDEIDSGHRVCAIIDF